MRNSKPSTLHSLMVVLLLWPCVLTKSVSPIQEANGSSLSAGPGEQRPHVARRSIQECDSSLDGYCMNQGQCMLLVDINQHHCKCVSGFLGPRCNVPDLATVQPAGEVQIMVILFCVALLSIGVAGALYFCCKWYKKNRFQPQPKLQGNKEVQTA